MLCVSAHVDQPGDTPHSSPVCHPASVHPGPPLKGKLYERNFILACVTAGGATEEQGVQRVDARAVASVETVGEPDGEEASISGGPRRGGRRTGGHGGAATH